MLALYMLHVCRLFHVRPLPSSQPLDNKTTFYELSDPYHAIDLIHLIDSLRYGR